MFFFFQNSCFLFLYTGLPRAARRVKSQQEVAFLRGKKKKTLVARVTKSSKHESETKLEIKHPYLYLRVTTAFPAAAAPHVFLEHHLVLCTGLDRSRRRALPRTRSTGGCDWLLRARRRPGGGGNSSRADWRISRSGWRAGCDGSTRRRGRCSTVLYISGKGVEKMNNLLSC